MSGPATPGRRGTGRRRAGLAARIALVTTAVAAVAVVLAGLASVGLVRGAAERQARDTLARQADILAGVTDPAGPSAARRPPVERLLADEGISVARLGTTGRVVGDAAAVIGSGDVAALQAGRAVSAVRRSGGRRVFLEARPLAAGGALALVQRASVAGGAVADVRRRTLAALLIGLVGAALAGVLLAQRLARPLRETAAAAHRMAGGARDVRVRPDGPAEVAEVATSLNRLGAALEVSESRQREFLLSVSHELRTPLTAVKGFAEALADRVTTGEDVAPTGAVILAEAGRLERLVEDLLDLARLGSQDFRIDPAPVDLVELGRAAAVVWSARCRESGVDFRLEVPDDELVVTSDATRVRQILDGLAANALRVTPAGAPIVLSVGVADHHALVQVRDGGPGLTEDDCRVAFERFALYDRYRGIRPVGTGVGLALVAGLAKRLGGTAQAARAAEGGACFTIRLPMGGHDEGRAGSLPSV
ncbi:MAG: HAMP domain-containing sensor histidine kinase [Mycobacteriales bacterium]